MNRAKALAVLLVLVIIAAAPAMAQSWTKSKWGSKDESGAANMISPRSVPHACRLVTRGKP